MPPKPHGNYISNPLLVKVILKHYFHPEKVTLHLILEKIYITKTVCREKQWWVLVWVFILSLLSTHHIYSRVTLCGMAYLLECSSAEAETSAFHVGMYISRASLFLFCKINCIDEYYFKDTLKKMFILRKRERAWAGKGAEKKGERIPSRLHAVSA